MGGVVSILIMACAVPMLPTMSDARNSMLFCVAESWLNGTLNAVMLCVLVEPFEPLIAAGANALHVAPPFVEKRYSPEVVLMPDPVSMHIRRSRWDSAWC